MFYDHVLNGLKVRVRLTPSGRAVCVNGLMKNVANQSVLKCTVTTPPEDGKANQALIKLLAKEWKLAKSTFEVLQGQTSRNKVLVVYGDPKHLAHVLEAWTKHKGIRA